MERGSGILLPIFSLPSRYGIGTFGKESHSFVLFLEKAQQKYWQLLPLNPTSYGDSPYQSFSAFALNPYFVDFDELSHDGLLSDEELALLPRRYEESIDYGRLYAERFKVLRLAYSHYLAVGGLAKLKRFLGEEEEWLEDYALFMVIKNLEQGHSWQEWPLELKTREPAALKKVKSENLDDFYFWVFLQQQAFKQYLRLRRYAKKHGVKIIGDIPIYVALDSADAWSHTDIFQLDQDLSPTKVAGVPPDYFSSTGQLWGNPLYDYQKLEQTDFAWWRYRVKKCAELYDVLRIDHFRGLDEYWAVPYGEKTAVNGSWVKGPGMKLVTALVAAAPQMQFIAEDLGLMTPGVLKLKKEAGWPGMKIYEFAFDSGYSNAFLPHNYETNCVAYIGTHDNDTLANFIEVNPDLHSFMKEYLHLDRTEDIHDTMIGTLMRSSADVVILCLQDLLKQGAQGRINTPGTLGGNWIYRLKKDILTNELAQHLQKLTEECER